MPSPERIIVWRDRVYNVITVVKKMPGYPHVGQWRAPPNSSTKRYSEVLYRYESQYGARP